MKIAEELVHDQTGLAERFLDLLTSVRPHTLQECLGLAMWTVHPYPLVDALGSLIEPTFDLHLVALPVLMLSRYEVGHDEVAVEQIDEKPPRRCQDPLDLVQNLGCSRARSRSSRKR